MTHFSLNNCDFFLLFRLCFLNGLLVFVIGYWFLLLIFVIGFLTGFCCWFIGLLVFTGLAGSLFFVSWFFVYVFFLSIICSVFTFYIADASAFEWDTADNAVEFSSSLSPFFSLQSALALFTAVLQSSRRSSFPIVALAIKCALVQARHALSPDPKSCKHISGRRQIMLSQARCTLDGLIAQKKGSCLIRIPKMLSCKV